MFGNKEDVKPDLPIYEVTDDLISALKHHKRAVLSAPPGAGKTTAVPLEILRAGLVTGKIVMLEPRRLAARAAAERMAEMLDEPVGDSVGYRIKGEQKTSQQTKIEVVTEGILTRIIQSDPELSGIGCVIFDEFHERSLHADLGLALCLEIAEAFRDDLCLLVMSATLEAEPVSRLLGDAPIVTSDGRSFPVDPIWLDRPQPKSISFEIGLRDLILNALNDTTGGMLVFLPGEREIKTLAALLKPHLGPEYVLHLLYGALPFDQQRAAIRPLNHGRKIVLATSIAETSLTIEDIRVVVDSGKARRAEFDPGTGMARLVTTRVSKHEATQRMGRAGRVAAGKCYKFWSQPEDGGMSLSSPAEMEVADLSSLALELALWGAEAAELAFLSPPHPTRLAEAQSLLSMLSALNLDGIITEHGKALARLPLHPRLGHLLAKAGKNGAMLAALLGERDVLSREAPKDFSLRLDLLKNPDAFKDSYSYAVNFPALSRVKKDAADLKKLAPKTTETYSPAQMLALAFPDRIGKRRKGQEQRYLLSGGTGAYFSTPDPVGNSPFIVAAELDGQKKEAGIRRAIAITEAEIRELFSDDITHVKSCKWSKRETRVIARQFEMLGAISLSSLLWKDPPQDQFAHAMSEGIGDIGLAFSDKEKTFMSRLAAAGPPYRDVTEAFLLETMENWLMPYLQGITTAKDWREFNKLPALEAMFSYSEMEKLNRIAPASFVTPLGRKIPIFYHDDKPEISLKLQEMFGQKTHPTVAGKPLVVTLLSPAGRPLQTTTDIPGFWKTSYFDVRKDMRGRYPKHPWPENPQEALPSLRTKSKK